MILRARPEVGGRVRRAPSGWWLIAVLLVVWELYEFLSTSPPIFLPGPRAILGAVPIAVRDGLIGDLAATLGRLFLGVFFGALAGTAVGLLVGVNATARRLVEPALSILYPLPKVALLPLLLLVFGLGELPRILLVALAAFFPFVINLAAGVAQISPTLLEVARIYGLGTRRRIRQLILPGAVPWALTGLRLALNIGLTTVLVVELAAARDGLGRRIWLAWELLRPEQLYLVLLIIGALGGGIRAAVDRLSRRLQTWRPAEERVL